MIHLSYGNQNVTTMTNDHTEFINWVNTNLQEQGWSIRELARRARISHVTIVNFLNGNRNPGEKLCHGLARAFKVPPTQILQMAGLDPIPPDMHDRPDNERELISYYRSLDNRGRRSILILARALYEERASYTTEEKGKQTKCPTESSA